MARIIFGIMILLLSLTLKGQKEEISVVKYIIRDLNLVGMISESLKAQGVDSLVATGYMPVLHARPLYDCKRISEDTLPRVCVEYIMKLECVTSDVIFYRGKVAKAIVDSIDIVLILNDFSGLVFVPYPSKLLVNSTMTDCDDYNEGVVLFKVVYDGKEYRGYNR